MNKKQKPTPAQILEATSKYFGLHPDRIRNYRKLTADDAAARVPRACTIALGLCAGLGYKKDEIFEVIPRKNACCVSKARATLDDNVRYFAEWRDQTTEILKMA